jgi:hypothetical protein
VVVPVSAQRRLRTGDGPTDFASLGQRDDAAPGLSCPILSGHPVVAVLAPSATTAVPHGLGRPLTGWFVVRQADPAVEPGEVSTDDKVIRLSNPTAGKVTLGLWVY